MVVNPNSHSLALLMALYALFQTVSRSWFEEVASNDQRSRRAPSGEAATALPTSTSVLPAKLVDTRDVKASWLNRAYTMLTDFLASDSEPNTYSSGNRDSELDVRYFLQEAKARQAIAIVKYIRRFIIFFVVMGKWLEGYIYSGRV